MSVIAVIGTGNIGGTIGRAVARSGKLEVVFGSRDPGSSKAAGDTAAKIATPAEAIAGADIVLLAVPGGEIPGLLRTHTAALDGKLVLDASNRFPGPVLNSAAEVAELAPGARYARAFNTQAWETYEEPTWDGVRGDLFYTSTEADRAAVEQLISAVGLRPLFVGEGRPDLLDALLFLLVSTFDAFGRHTGLRLLTDAG
ncbi:NADPH-dependent F420 reductase [Streptacidiphilus sp. N1-12]|uniref:NADPH-dependent F420 reductase n=2 Tax=Streptacidiphilus alkalitolerans TaxID=3342712 RepID=A0ABV6V6L5_9ACTN